MTKETELNDDRSSRVREIRNWAAKHQLRARVKDIYALADLQLPIALLIAELDKLRRSWAKGEIVSLAYYWFPMQAAETRWLKGKQVASGEGLTRPDYSAVVKGRSV
jgi:hypothetical protein